MNHATTQKYLQSLGFEVSSNSFSENSKKTVIVGMSGGVDSSVCAILMKLLGYNTIGMFMKNWEEKNDDGVCLAEDEYQDVIRVCEQIDIPYYSVNFSHEYEQNVFKHFLAEYKKGNTPNPDILCNKEIKFKVFYNKAMEFGADFLVTGHYCQKQEVNSQTLLAKGKDRGKDQTYFLYTMQEDVLENVLFPIGHLEKPEVRKIARDFNLATKSKKDSTGICFIGERNFKNFLSQYIKSQQGSFVHLDSGRVLGSHDGSCYYTNGQRKGLGLGGPGGPWFVSHKDQAQNIVYVVEGEMHPALYADNLFANEIHWINQAPSFPLECMAKIRYRQVDQACRLELQADGSIKVEFQRPQRAISIGQALVFYQDDICLGGATVCDVGPSYQQQKKELPIL
ncbi:MAG: tRNA 2-thiouridine(34) synthase MnmA [Halobacteriovoraceae bacterium]|jgi:tRNA-uridine 2-sulfurtransferase|nr:tRNA 2-thiouridine(34) synthase MnmA [Halobacteriovoraceae bacterium]